MGMYILYDLDANWKFYDQSYNHPIILPVTLTAHPLSYWVP